ncbi:DUF3024 domain-containing protein [Saccharibacillus sp. CPCC 101409]|uniref:DUF6933 domain-containing protein n=1 Tax=Saccharibacillus sp. CPCC 101409 TaxID=3058041 RepID=UPI002673AB26|nr:DUF3024 domain-containing protein [Saccharibacillus sp. CPCC 101409]MDO3410549.1 DUF3024 domain-containing protein [Saccharibacillus sp. CPCC 101409]
MIALKCTQALFKDMKAAPAPVELEGIPDLLCWHVNLYKLNNRKHIVFVNDASRLAILIDGVRSGQIGSLQKKFVETLERYLLVEGVEEESIEAYLRCSSEVFITRTDNRSVLGTMKEVTYFTHDDFNDPIERMKWINRLIHKPIDYLQPIDVFITELGRSELIQAAKTTMEEKMDDFTRTRVIRIMDQYTQNAVPESIRDQVRMIYDLGESSVTLMEERPAFQSEEWVKLPIAQFRLRGGRWKVYWQDSRDNWHYVYQIEPSEDFERQLKIVDEDRTGMFWG